MPPKALLLQQLIPQLVLLIVLVVKFLEVADPDANVAVMEFLEVVGVQFLAVAANVGNPEFISAVEKRKRGLDPELNRNLDLKVSLRLKVKSE
jgi:hypothetical protein